jgi:hypothetical protein
MRLRRFGRIRADLYKLRTRTWNASLGAGNDPLDVALLQGRATVRRGRTRAALPIAGAIFRRRGVDSLQLNLVVDTRLGNKRGIEVVVPLAAKFGQVASSPLALLKGTGCGAAPRAGIHTPEELDSLNRENARLGARIAAVKVREIGIATVADPLWESRYGETSNAVIAALINAANTLYEREVGLALEILDQRSAAISAPTQPGNAAQWLESFQSFAATTLANRDFDVKFLFTHRSFSTQVIGLAYVGVVCRSPAFSVGLIKGSAPALNFITFAHELAHTLDADHDPHTETRPCPAAIMCPFVDSAHTSFSRLSRRSIASYIEEHGSCLGWAESGSSPAPAPPVGSSSSAGGSEKLPLLRLGSSLSATGRFTLQITITGAIPAETKFTLSLSDSKSFRPHSTRRLEFLPDGPGKYLVTSALPFGVRTRAARFGANVRRRVFIRLEARRRSAAAIALTAVDPRRVKHKAIPLRTWMQLLGNRLKQTRR